VVYYALAVRGTISLYKAAFIGMLPGLVSLVIYAGYALTRHMGTPAEALFAAAFVPAVVQSHYLNRMSGNAADFNAGRSIRVLDGRAVSVLGILVLLSIASTHLRDTLGALSATFAALIIVALNSLMSLTNTFTRALFMRNQGETYGRRLAAASAMPAVAALFVVILMPPVGSGFALLATQGLICAVIAAARLDKGQDGALLMPASSCR
jgi:hypothetical protein